MEFNGEKITSENSLAKIIIKYDPGDEVSLKILRNGKEMTFTVTLGEKSGYVIAKIVLMVLIP